MQRPKLTVQKRTVLGKKIKSLRKEGILPANIYGKDVASQAVQVAYASFMPIYDEVKETGLLDVAVDGKVVPVLIKNVQLDYLTKKPLHADFFQVNLKEKVKSMVPLTIVGEAKAVIENIGILMPLLSEVEVEALPEELPESIEVNVEPLSAVDEQITVENLKVPEHVALLTDPSQVVVKIAELVSKEAQEQAAQEAAAAEAAKEEAATEEASETKEEKAEEKPSETPEKETKEEKPQ